ncbi:MAG: lysine 2,3-aminomutase [Planctomycetota bacterium]|jgi:L-lysine 2,3-aminomutase|nr:lysine 2,3-aminomutase [Planctomycetota bacterium]
MPPQYRSYSSFNFRELPQIAGWPEARKIEIEALARVLPFKTNNYVVEQLVDWGNIPDDPIYTLNFPRREMLRDEHYGRIKAAMDAKLPDAEIKAAARDIQIRLNPDPSGQSSNVPIHNGERLEGVQHKYQETVLMFPQAGQTCHAYCTFCFRWPQFTGLSEAKYIAREGLTIADYIRTKPLVTDLLLTGGDPMIMTAEVLEQYLDPFLDGGPPNLRTIRIGTKSLAYWPHRYLSDRDSDDIMRLFERIAASGRTLAIMAHFNHPVELSTGAVEKAIRRIQGTGAQIRTQSPLLGHINDDPAVWARLWRRQVDLNLIPYYMFVERDTGAKHFFALTLQRCWEIFREGYQRLSGLCRTVRGPVMSAYPGKVEILGFDETGGEKAVMLRFIQGRNPDWTNRPFFARFDPEAVWFDQLRPAFGKPHFFFEEELRNMQSVRLPATGSSLGY